MFVNFMYADEWHDRRDLGTSAVSPTWDQVQQAIRMLDGKRRTMVSLSDKEDGERMMIVAGQLEGRFVVNATPDNVDFFSLVDASRSTKNVKLRIGGQDGEYEERKCVLLDWVLEAAQAFYDSGELKASMHWQSDY